MLRGRGRGPCWRSLHYVAPSHPPPPYPPTAPRRCLITRKIRSGSGGSSLTRCGHFGCIFKAATENATWLWLFISYALYGQWAYENGSCCVTSMAKIVSRPRSTWQWPSWPCMPFARLQCMLNVHNITYKTRHARAYAASGVGVVWPVCGYG